MILVLTLYTPVQFVNLFGSSNSWNDTYNIVTIQYVLGDDYTYFLQKLYLGR